MAADRRASYLVRAGGMEGDRAMRARKAPSVPSGAAGSGGGKEKETHAAISSGAKERIEPWPGCDRGEERHRQVGARKKGPPSPQHLGSYARKGARTRHAIRGGERQENETLAARGLWGGEKGFIYGRERVLQGAPCAVGRERNSPSLSSCRLARDPVSVWEGRASARLFPRAKKKKKSSGSGGAQP